jgi:hypothetical protein
MKRLIMFVMLIGCCTITGCANKIVQINSDPTGAEVLTNLERLGTTPLTTSKDEIMPFWRSDMVPTYAVITIRKSGFQDYKVRVSEYDMPDKINANLFPSPVQEKIINNQTSGQKESIEIRLAAIKRFYDKGTVTKDEYESKRKEILDRM